MKIKEEKASMQIFKNQLKHRDFSVEENLRNIEAQLSRKLEGMINQIEALRTHCQKHRKFIQHGRKNCRTKSVTSRT